jgi:hypothetical protein
MVFDLFQVKDWLHGADLDLRCECLLAAPPIFFCFGVSTWTNSSRLWLTLDVYNFRFELPLNSGAPAVEIGSFCCCSEHSL